MKVSVIIPVYNAERYLRKCLDSVLNQTLRDIEIICVDDSSTDDSLKILNEYAVRDSRVRVITQENGGAGKARNTGMDAASGEFLSFLDADDFFETSMLEEAWKKAVSDWDDLVVFGSDQYFEEVSEGEKKKGSFVRKNWVIRLSEIPPFQPFNFRQMTDNVFKVFVGWAWDKLFRTSFVKKHGLRFQEQRSSNDMLFVFSAIVLAERISVLPDVYAHQRRDAADSVSKTREKSWDCFYSALMALRDRLREADSMKNWSRIISTMHFISHSGIMIRWLNRQRVCLGINSAQNGLKNWESRVNREAGFTIRRSMLITWI